MWWLAHSSSSSSSRGGLASRDGKCEVRGVRGCGSRSGKDSRKAARLWKVGGQLGRGLFPCGPEMVPPDLGAGHPCLVGLSLLCNVACITSARYSACYLRDALQAAPCKSTTQAAKPLRDCISTACVSPAYRQPDCTHQSPVIRLRLASPQHDTVSNTSS